MSICAMPHKYISRNTNNKGKHKMLKKLKKLLQGVITKTNSYHSAVERYVASKNPTSIGEVEYWIRQYDRNGGKYGY